jgi:DNA sulfur modification protein DndE
MSFNRLRVSERATSYFPILKGRTGLTPNILCRMALCLSIADPSIPNPKLEDEKGQEFNRYTLLGEWDAFFISILRERLIHDSLDVEKDLMTQFKAHLNRGIIMLFSRVKSLDNIYDLIPTGPVYSDKQKEYDQNEQKRKKNGSIATKEQ